MIDLQAELQAALATLIVFLAIASIPWWDL